MDYEEDTDFTELPAGYHIAGEDEDEEFDDDILPHKKTDDEEDEFDFDDSSLDDDPESELF